MGTAIKDGYYDCKSRNKEFHRVMQILAQNFARCHRNYVNAFKEKNGSSGDVGWFYNERANISFLAAAAWRQSKWVAIEEYACSKKVMKEKSRGRADLFIGTPSLDLSIEAKMAWTPTKKQLYSALDPSSKSSSLSRAIADARATPADGLRCGVVFVCPNIDASNKEKLDSKIDEVFEAFWDAPKNFSRFDHWAAFSFVSPMVSQTWKERKGVVAYPAVGVVLVSA